MPTRDALIPILRRYFDKDPAEAARTLETLSDEKAAALLAALPAETASAVFDRLAGPFASRLISAASPERFEELAKKLSADQAASVFLSLSPDKRQLLLDRLPTRLREQMQEVLAFPEDSAGRIMRPQFTAFHPEVKVRDAIQKLRELAARNTATSYVYVIDADKHLLGVANMRDLLIASPESTLGKVMRTQVFSIDAFTDREIVAQEFGKRRYFAAPVVDAQNRLLGVVNADHLLRDVQEEATEDVQQMVGAGKDERAFSPVGFTLKKRLPWLHVNLVTAFMAAAVVSLFEGIIAEITVLAVFLPVVAGQGGNAGAQSLAVVMRGIVMREIPPNRAGKLIAKETLVGAANGVIIGLITAAVAWAWHGNPYLGLVIGMAMLVNLAIAGFFGAIIPLGMKQMGLDPAQSSSIILTTVTDVMGFFSFLGFAVLFRSFLI